MHEHFQPVRWETPFSDAANLFLESFTHSADRGLTVRLTALQSELSRSYEVVWERVVGYRNLNESFRNDLWQQLHGRLKDLGCAWQLNREAWIAQIPDHKLLLEIHPHLRHFLIATEDDVVEVLASVEPAIRELGHGAESSGYRADS